MQSLFWYSALYWKSVHFCICITTVTFQWYKFASCRIPPTKRPQILEFGRTFQIQVKPVQNCTVHVQEYYSVQYRRYYASIQVDLHYCSMCSSPEKFPPYVRETGRTTSVNSFMCIINYGYKTFESSTHGSLISSLFQFVTVDNDQSGWQWRDLSISCRLMGPSTVYTVHSAMQFW